MSSTKMRQFCHGIWCILTWRAAVGKSEVQVSADMPSQITFEQWCLARNAISHICSEVAELQGVNKENINYSSFRWNLSPTKKNLQRLNLLFSPICSSEFSATWQFNSYHPYGEPFFLNSTCKDIQKQSVICKQLWIKKCTVLSTVFLPSTIVLPASKTAFTDGVEALWHKKRSRKLYGWDWAGVMFHL